MISQRLWRNGKGVGSSRGRRSQLVEQSFLLFAIFSCMIRITLSIIYVNSDTAKDHGWCQPGLRIVRAPNLARRH